MSRENCCCIYIKNNYNLRQKIYNIKLSSDAVNILQELNKDSLDDILDILYIEFS